MSDFHILNFLRTAEYVAFEVARTASFFYVLWLVVEQHCHFKRGLLKIARFIVVMHEQNSGHRTGISNKLPE